VTAIRSDDRKRANWSDERFRVTVMHDGPEGR
jgi:hypothetical protein